MKTIECKSCMGKCTEKLNFVSKGFDYNLLKCSNCGLKFFVSEKFEKLDDDQYWNDANVKVYKQQSVLKEFKIKHKKYLSIVERKSPPNNKLLDVGCGSGIFVENSKKFGLDAVGIEPSSKARNLCQEQFSYKPMSGYLVHDSDLDKNYGIVTAWDVLEHVSDPSLFISICHNHLVDNGVLLLETPNESSFVRKLLNLYSSLKSFKPKFSSSLYYPCHRYYFTEKSIKILLESSGFNNIEIYRDHSIFSKSLEKYKSYRKLTKFKSIQFKIIFAVLKIPVLANKQILICKKVIR